MRQDLRLENLSTFRDGRAGITFDQRVRLAVLDCLDRPLEAKERTVMLTLKLKPDVDARGDVLGVKARIQFGGKHPDQETREVDVQVDANGQAYYNDLSAENANQRTLDEADPEAWDNQEEQS